MRALSAILGALLLVGCVETYETPGGDREIGSCYTFPFDAGQADGCGRTQNDACRDAGGTPMIHTMSGRPVCSKGDSDFVFMDWDH